jgi:filamentous hemagglutinin family protein
VIRGSRYRWLLLAGTALMSLGARLAVAGPDGGQVVGGSATINGQGTRSVTIDQSSQNLIINWQTFNIGRGESTTFNQPNGNAIALNRVVGGLGPSFLDGTLTANGRVFIINGDGILFGPHSSITTAGFLASTHDIRNSDFMAGRYNFSIPGNPAASIVNLGSITATSGGFAALVAPGVRNSGTITATLGTVALAAGNAFTLDFYGDRLITLAVNDQIAQQVIDVETGKPLKSLVGNDGKLSANGGRVELTAAAARAVVDSVINTSGVIEADSVGTRNGKIVLSATTAASKPAGAPVQTVKVAGKISAAGKDKGSKGGTVVVSGESIALAGATIDASGDAGGGHVLIGGDSGGGHPGTAAAAIELARLEAFAVPTASTVSVDAATVINASATGTGNGGKVVLWSNQQTTFAGTILARGGASGGNGGFVETSSHGVLNIDGGQVNTSAPLGTTGTWLLDPTNLTIDSAAGATISSNLASTNVMVTTNADGTTSGPGLTSPGAGDIDVLASISWSSNNTLTLSAFHDIIFNESGHISNSGAGNLILRADNTGSGSGTVTFFGSQQVNLAAGTTSIYYNPTCNISLCNKYQSPLDSIFARHVSGNMTAYMLVNNAGDLRLMGQNLGDQPTILGNFALGRNITLDSDANRFDGFADGTTFNGLFTGNGGLGTNYTISNLNLSAPGHNFDSYGVFPIIGSQGVVRDLVLQDGRIAAGGNTQSIGLLAGQNFGQIINVSVTSGENGSLVDGGSFAGISAGGLVGFNGGVISNSASAATVRVGDGAFCSNTDCAGLNFAGGLVGNNSFNFGGAPAGAISSTSLPSGGTVTASSASGNVSGGVNSIIGGLVGENTGAVVFSSASGDVRLTTNISPDSAQFSSSFAGGLVGQNGNGGPGPNNFGIILSSHATGNVTGVGLALAIGGLAGDNSTGSSIIDSQAFGGRVTADSDGTLQSQFNNSVSAGGLVGFNQGVIAGTTSPPPPGASCLAGAAYSCAGGDVHVGALGQGGGLVGNNDGTLLNVFASGNIGGAAGVSGDPGSFDGTTRLGGLAGVNSGTIGSAYAIGTVGTNGIAFLEVGGLIGANHGAIGNSAAYGSVFAGDHSVAGGFVGSSGPSNNDCGGCTVGDGHDNSATIFASSARGSVSVGHASFAGGFAGTGDGNFSLVSAFGNVLGGANVVLGGLVGGMGALEGPSFITQSTASGTVTSTGPNSTLGGLVGLNGGTIDSSQASGAAVSGTSFSYLGGLVGINLGVIHNSSSSSQVIGSGSNNIAGGAVGANLGLINPTTASGNVSSGADSFVGGLVGANEAFNNFLAGQFLGSSFPIGTISFNSIASGSVSGGPGSSVGAQVGIDFPLASPNLPSYLNALVSSCNNAVCTVLANGVLFDPNGTNLPPPLPTTEAQFIQNLVQNVTLASLTLGDVVVNTQGLDQSSSAPAGGAPPQPGPGGLPPQFGPRFFVPPPPGETRFVPNEVVLQIPSNIPLARLQSVLASLGLSILDSQSMPLIGVTSYRVHIDNGQSIAAVIQALARQQIVAGA